MSLALGQHVQRHAVGVHRYGNARSKFQLSLEVKPVKVVKPSKEFAMNKDAQVRMISL